MWFFTMSLLCRPGPRINRSLQFCADRLKFSETTNALSCIGAALEKFNLEGDIAI